MFLQDLQQCCRCQFRIFLRSFGIDSGIRPIFKKIVNSKLHKRDHQIPNQIIEGS